MYNECVDRQKILLFVQDLERPLIPINSKLFDFLLSHQILTISLLHGSIKTILKNNKFVICRRKQSTIDYLRSQQIYSQFSTIIYHYGMKNIIEKMSWFVFFCFSFKLVIGTVRQTSFYISQVIFWLEFSFLQLCYCLDN